MIIESIQSILNQTFSDFEFLIGDDGSDTGFSDIEEIFDDERIIWIRNEKNIGITKTLNKLLGMAKGKYIARMDADDISLPTRFEEQVRFMERHKEFIASGTQAVFFGDKSGLRYYRDQSNIREETQAYLFFSNKAGLVHPSVVFCKSMLDKYNIRYDERYPLTQDYYMFVQCTKYAPIATLPKVLVKYRRSGGQVTIAKNDMQVYYADCIRLEQLANLDIVPNEDEKKRHLSFCKWCMYGSIGDMHKWMDRLRQANHEKKYYNEQYFDIAVSDVWYVICAKEYRSGNKEFRWEYIKAMRPRLMLRRMVKKAKFHIIKYMNR